MREIHALILTLNEEMHIGRCISSIKPLCTTITVIDSGSTDRTAEIARSKGAKVLVNPFASHAAQINFGIEALAGSGGWILRIDADEVLTDGSAKIIAQELASVQSGVGGILLRRRIVFMGRPMLHGGMGSVWVLRLWREGQGKAKTAGWTSI